MTAPPRVSVIMPAFFSQGTIGGCLAALRRQTFRDFETIVVNSSPETETERLVRSEFPEVTFVQNATRLLPHGARNSGVERARGEILVFTDPDVRPRTDWLERLVAAHDEGHTVVGGSMALRTRSWFEVGVHVCKFHSVLGGEPGTRWIVPTANASYSRAAWQAVGAFDADIFCGDATQSWKARAAGHPPWFEPRAVVEHHHGGDLRSFRRQRTSRGEEFASARMRFEGWSRSRAAAHVACAPLLSGLVLLRAGRDAIRSGWLLGYLATLPLQAVGQMAWSLGEARAQLRQAAANRGNKVSPEPASGAKK